MKKIADLLYDVSLTFPERLAVTDGDIFASYNKLNEYVENMAGVLKVSGCGPGVSIGLLFPNSIEYLIAFFAVSRAGGTIVPINSSSTNAEIGKLIERCNISIMICNKSILERKLPDTLPVSLITAELSSKGINIETVSFKAPLVEKELSNVALLIGTSGSTGKSKFVMLTDSNLIANLKSYRQSIAFEGIQRVYCILSMCHIYTIAAQLLTHISLGDELYINRPPFNSISFLKDVQNRQITVTAFVPYMTHILAGFSNSVDYDTSSLRIVTISGAKASVKILQSLAKKFPDTKFLPTYGLTEAGPRVSLSRPDDGAFPLAGVGTPLLGVKVKIDSPDASAQNVGEVLVKSPGVMKGYYKNRQATADFLKDGWLRTGDLGFLDDSDYLHLVGRKKNLIISGGMNIYPPEIEEALMEHENITGAAVMGMKHDLLQEVPCAFIETSCTDQKAVISQLKSRCIENFSLYKVPYRFICLEKIPRLSNSKVNYSKLKELLYEFN